MEGKGFGIHFGREILLDREQIGLNRHCLLWQSIAVECNYKL
jgi:hypothetical protein